MTHSQNAHSFAHMIQTFGFEDEDAYAKWLKNTYKDTSIPTGKELISALLEHRFEQNHIPDTIKPMIHEVFDAGISKDPVTGGLNKEWNDFFLKTYQLAADNSALNPTQVVELDFSNMSGANQAIGRKPVDRSVAIISTIYADTLTQAGAKITAVRTGGDELRFYTQGLGDEALEKAIAKAQDKIATFTAELGTDALEHNKYKGDPVRTGFGAGAGHTALHSSGQTAQQLSESLDSQIDAHKVAIGKDKNLSTNHIIPADILHKRLSKDTVEQTLNAWEKDLHVATSAHKDNTPELLRVTNPTPDTYRARENKARAFSKDWDEASQHLLLDGVKLYNAYDPTSGLKAPKALIDDLAFFKTLEHTQHPPIITLFEITNLRGLNKHRNHEEANSIIHSTVNNFAHDLGAQLQEPNFEQRLYSLGSSRFALITTNTDAETLNTAIHTVSQRRQHSLKISSQVEKLKDPDTLTLAEIPNPTKQVIAVTGKSKPEQGIMITHVSMPLIKDAHISSKSQLQILEDLSDVYGFRPEAARIHADQKDQPILKGEVNLALGHTLPWSVGNTEVAAVQTQGIPHDIAKYALEGKRIPRESLPRIVADLESHLPTPQPIIVTQGAMIESPERHHGHSFRR